MIQALKRLFLILFPLSLFCLALFLTNTKKSLDQKNIIFSKNKKNSFTLLNTKCPFYYGFSFHPITEKKQNIFKNKKTSSPPLTTYLLSKQNFLKKLQSLKKELQKHDISFKKVLLVIPLVLTKDKEWLVSKKTFFILPSGEKKEVSHLNYSQVTKLHKNFKTDKFYSPLKLSEVLSELPDNNFLFSIKGSNREALMEQLAAPLLENLKGEIFLTSSNEKLLTDIALQTQWKILHSFKSLLRFQMMRIFQAHSWMTLPGQGFLIPSFFSLSLKDMEFLKEQKKNLFFKKDPPYDLSSQLLIQKSNALISSKPQPTLSIIKKKKPCFIAK